LDDGIEMELNRTWVYVRYRENREWNVYGRGECFNLEKERGLRILDIWFRCKCEENRICVFQSNLLNFLESYVECRFVKIIRLRGIIFWSMETKNEYETYKELLFYFI